MLGLQFIKVQPTTYLIQYSKGKIVREGPGLAFYYYSPTTSLVAVPIASTDVPFIFNEVTADFQQISVQGQATYRIIDPKRTAALLNFTIHPVTRDYLSDDPQKLSQRIINIINVLTRKLVETQTLREALRSSEALVRQVKADLAGSAEITELGVEVIGLSVLAIRPNPETARALEAEAREILLREADQAVYARRNSAVEQERAIKENELNTEIAVENKKRQIRESQMDAERAVQQKQHEMHAAQMRSSISLEVQNKEYVALSTENARNQADARAYALGATVRALDGANPETLQILASSGMKPEQVIALAFRQLSESADKIGQLNISPDLLRELLNSSGQ